VNSPPPRSPSPPRSAPCPPANAATLPTRERVAHTPFAGPFPPRHPSPSEIHLKGDVDGQDRIHSSQHAHSD
jgi:hypothetical protein